MARWAHDLHTEGSHFLRGQSGNRLSFQLSGRLAASSSRLLSRKLGSARFGPTEGENISHNLHVCHNRARLLAIHPFFH